MTIPLFMSFLEYIFLGRSFPDLKSLVSLAGVACCIAVYLFYDHRGGFSATAWTWLMAWYCWTIFEGIYVKHVVSTTELSTLQQTFYLNFLSIPVLALAAYHSEYTMMNTFFSLLPLQVLVVLALSCILGTGMSFFTFSLRNEVSATTFAVIGNLCKIFTIALNWVAWSLHASSTGTAAILLCIILSTMYSQAPLRKDVLPGVTHVTTEASCSRMKTVK